uniref:Uncharacterized protein n=1 Tax=Solanum lycopersicum TaxID=4081 RepID=A0A3Q7HBU5_SOLLC
MIGLLNSQIEHSHEYVDRVSLFVVFYISFGVAETISLQLSEIYIKSKSC